jgi:DNA-binding NtrC family response regulator
MFSDLIRFGICSDDTLTRALLRRAAEQLSCVSQSLDAENAPRWLSAHPSAWLLLDCTQGQADDVLVELAQWPASLTDRVLLLQDASEPQDTWPAALNPMRTHARPNDAPEAVELIRRLIGKRGAKAGPAGASNASTQARPPPPGRGQAASAADAIDTDGEAYATAKRLAQYPVDLLLCGETGSGKDSLARFIYEQSGSTGQFVPVNCAAIPENLAESELFGFEAGAFTGAVRASPGKIADADKGVLYLDEVDSCPLWLQAKLLRVLQDKGAERVGSSKFRHSDFRLIASTKAHLPTLVEKGQFRQDLYFRISVIEICLPPIRSQPDRLQVLFQRFVMESCERFRLNPQSVDAKTLSWLMAHPWPGNIRELKTAATRYTLSLSSGHDEKKQPEKTSLRSALDACERGLLISTLARTNGNVTLASDELGMPLNTLYYRLKRLGLNQKRPGRFEDSRQ